VAAEPEPMEYVRVCDAFGTGYFYIPGTETCLKIGGEVRATLEFGDFYDDDDADDEDWDSSVRARVNFEAKNDSEIGTIGSYIQLEATADGFGTDGVAIQQAYITVGGFKVGYAASFWDDVGIPGENDFLDDNTVFNLASYTYSSDAFSAGVEVDDLSEWYVGEEVGVQGMVSASMGAFTATIRGVYDFGAEEGAVAGTLAAEVGPGTLTLRAAYNSGFNVYVVDILDGVEALEWTVGGAYAFKATDKLTITPSASYYEGHDGETAWSAGILASYQLAEGLTTSATVDYRDFDTDVTNDGWNGFVRLTRSF
ncbi:MAG: porin, partial [Allorhizobium sp.]